MQDNEKYGDQIFSQNQTSESDRLSYISDTYDQTSRNQIAARGLKANMRCLDVGAGNGSIAIWLAAQLEAVSGEVVALDRDTRLLEQQTNLPKNLTILQQDLLQDGDPIGQFDLVHARFVLMHLPERARLLEKLAAWVKPGGWLILSESIDLTTQQASYAPYKEAMAAMWISLQKTIGTDITWAQQVPKHMQHLNFQEVGSEVYLPSADAHSSVAKFWRLTWAQMQERLVSVGQIPPSTLQLAVEALSKEDFTELSPGMLTCWGRKPIIS